METQPRRPWLQGLALGALMLVVGGASLCPGRPRPVVLDCPHYGSRVLFTSPDAKDTLLAPLSGRQVDQPEYNDCQRLQRSDAKAPADVSPLAYGPLTAVYASQRLVHLAEDQQAASTAGGKPMAIAAATVVAFGGRYPELGIARGANCLYLWEAGDWHARLVPVEGNGLACTVALDQTSTRGTRLDVRVEHIATDTIPAVARWERNERGGQTIGIRCGLHDWCTIGAVAFRPAAVPVPVVDAGFASWLAGLPGEDQAQVTIDAGALRRRLSVRGWLDEQRLAPAGGGQGPSLLWAEIIPHPRLDAMVAQDFTPGRWQVAAFVWIPENPGAIAANPAYHAALHGYATKLNFHVGWNAISLCSGAPSNCFPAGGPAVPTCHGTLEPDQERWYARVQARSGENAYFCVKRIPHDLGVNAAGVHVAGAARWRWVRSDATTWMRCVDGCCEVEGNP